MAMKNGKKSAAASLPLLGEMLKFNLRQQAKMAFFSLKAYGKIMVVHLLSLDCNRKQVLKSESGRENCKCPEWSTSIVIWWMFNVFKTCDSTEATLAAAASERC